MSKHSAIKPADYRQRRWVGAVCKGDSPIVVVNECDEMGCDFFETWWRRVSFLSSCLQTDVLPCIQPEGFLRHPIIMVSNQFVLLGASETDAASNCTAYLCCIAVISNGGGPLRPRLR